MWTSLLFIILLVPNRFWHSSNAHAWTLPRVDLVTTRRVNIRQTIGLTGICSFAPPASSSTPKNSFVEVKSRLIESILKQRPVSAVSTGIDNTFYPQWLCGTWQVTQTLINVETPIGLIFAGGPNGITSIAEKTVEESRSRINQPVSLQLRYVKSLGGTVEDKLFNTRQRLNNFAGRSIVASVQYADTVASNRAAIKKAGGSDDDPLSTVFIQFKGPAAQKTFTVAHHSSVESGFKPADPSVWNGFECSRSLFALTNESTVPPITTDTETIFQYQRLDENHVTGKLRLAGYLNPNDKLYFEARNRAVTLLDYTLDLKRVITDSNLLE